MVSTFTILSHIGLLPPSFHVPFSLLCVLIHRINSYMSQRNGVGILDSLVARCSDDETILNVARFQNNFAWKLS